MYFKRCYGIIWLHCTDWTGPPAAAAPPKGAACSDRLAFQEEIFSSKLCGITKTFIGKEIRQGAASSLPCLHHAMKRTDYINWDEYFMGIALLSAMRSKDPNSQVGACIVSPENKILSLGYYGMPIGCDDDAMPWDREGSPWTPNICTSAMPS